MVWGWAERASQNVFDAAAGGVYAPRTDGVKHPHNADSITILPKQKAYAPSFEHEPNAGLFDVNAVGNDTVGETRRQLKAKYISARYRLIGKQLSCIENYESIFDFTNTFVKWNSGKFEMEGPLGDHYRNLQKILRALELEMTEDEKDKTSSMLSDFRKGLANYLVENMDPYDPESRKEAIQRTVLCTAVTFQKAEKMVEKALMLRAQCFAHSLLPTIIDKETEGVAIQKVQEECNCRQIMAVDLVERALAGEFVETEAQMKVRDSSVESTSINKERAEKYLPLMEWWAAQRKGDAAKEQQNAADRSCLPDLSGITDFGVASMQTSMMNAKIDAMMPAAKELEQLTLEFEQLEAKWKVYLGLSVANELGEYDGSQGKSARRKQAKQLRSDIQTEMRQALRGMLHAIMHEIDPEDNENLEEVDRMLLDLEAVEVQTDEYVHRLEANLTAIRQGEQAQVDSMLMQQELQKEVLGRIDNVNAGLTDNLKRMKELGGHGTIVLRLLCVVACCMAILFGAFFFQKLS